MRSSETTRAAVKQTSFWVNTATDRQRPSPSHINYTYRASPIWRSSRTVCQFSNKMSQSQFRCHKDVTYDTNLRLRRGFQGQTAVSSDLARTSAYLERRCTGCASASGFVRSSVGGSTLCAAIYWFVAQRVGRGHAPATCLSSSGQMEVKGLHQPGHKRKLPAVAGAVVGVRTDSSSSW